MTPLIIGVDVGNSNVSAALVDGSGSIRVKERVRVPSGLTGADHFQLVLQAIKAVTAAATGNVIGVGFGGPVDVHAGTVLRSHQTAGWENFPICDRLEAAFGLPVRLDNDANAAGLGELLFGAARGARDVLYVNIGTGIGGAVISDGRLLRGATCVAGEIGHTLVAETGPVCTCGRVGCLEAMASGTGIGRRARALAEQKQTDTSLTAEATAEDVFRLAAAGDAGAQQVLADTVYYLARGIANACALTNPEVIVLGGGVAEVGAALLDPLRDALQQWGMPEVVRNVKLVTAVNGYDAGVLGAAALAIDLLNHGSGTC